MYLTLWMLSFYGLVTRGWTKADKFIYNEEIKSLSTSIEINMDTPRHNTLMSRLSCDAQVFYPGDQGYANATDRWTEWSQPGLDVVIEVACEEDVAQAVRYANEQGKPFLAVSGKHGGTLGLGKVSHGVGIWMHNLNGIEVAADGTTAKAGGGIVSKKFVHALWEQGK